MKQRHIVQRPSAPESENSAATPAHTQLVCDDMTLQRFAHVTAKIDFHIGVEGSPVIAIFLPDHAKKAGEPPDLTDAQLHACERAPPR